MNEETAIKFLESKGYTIEKLPYFFLKTHKDLAKYFYFKAYGTNKIPRKHIYEYAYATNFIKQMSENEDYKDKLAIHKCKWVIDIVFDHIDYFNTLNLNSINIFTLEKNDWIIEKCLSFDTDKIYMRTGYTEKEYNSLQEMYEENINETIKIEETKQELLELLEV